MAQIKLQCEPTNNLKLTVSTIKNSNTKIRFKSTWKKYFIIAINPSAELLACLAPQQPAEVMLHPSAQNCQRGFPLQGNGDTLGNQETVNIGS